jgi:abhydrolase domain-containing protein 17
MCCCCCCCPPAISALFCLWVQSGFSKGTVAGALTFFPPEPALYQFERHSKTGRVLAPDEEEEEEEHVKSSEDTKNADKSNDNGTAMDDDGVVMGTTTTTSMDANEKTKPFELQETRAKTQKKLKSPVEQLTDQAAERRDVQKGVTFRLLLDPRLSVPPHDEHAIHAVKIPSPRGVFIAAVIYRVPIERQTLGTKTILISHGNATDNGAMFPIQVVLAHSLDCHVVVYDYSGYGESGGVPTECATYRDMEAVWDYTVDQVATDRSGANVILYGQSVGSGPCCYLAAKPDETVGGLVLHSPFTSGMRVLTPSRYVVLSHCIIWMQNVGVFFALHTFSCSLSSALACLDIYPNIDRIKKVKCPVMVIHGCLDQEVDVSHGQELFRAVPEPYQREPWWVADRGHNDITDGPGKLADYIRRLRRFVQSL